MPAGIAAAVAQRSHGAPAIPPAVIFSPASAIAAANTVSVATTTGRNRDSDQLRRARLAVLDKSFAGLLVALTRIFTSFNAFEDHTQQHRHRLQHPLGECGRLATVATQVEPCERDTLQGRSMLQLLDPAPLCATRRSISIRTLVVVLFLHFVVIRIEVDAGHAGHGVVGSGDSVGSAATIAATAAITAADAAPIVARTPSPNQDLVSQDPLVLKSRLGMP